MEIRHITHLNITCENILLDGNLTAKLADFGSAQHDISLLDSVTGSEFYRSPEICSEPLIPYDGKKADIFALAVVLYSMQLKTLPFEKANVLKS